MSKVFISYRRIPSAMLAQLLAKELKRRHIEAFVDTRSVDGAGPFPDRLLRAIEEADVFVCLLADTTLGSDWVRREIQHAHDQGKPLIPVFQESYQAPSDPEAHISALLQCDGVHFLDVKSLFIDESIKQLASMIKKTPEVQKSAVSLVIQAKDNPSPPPMPVRQHSIDFLPSPFEWILVPTGVVTLTTERWQAKSRNSEDGPKTFDVPVFAIAKYPVTTAQYAKFVEAGGYNQQKWWTEAGWEAREQGIAWNGSEWKPTGKAWSEPLYYRNDPWNGADYPIVGVSWYEAMAFCQWLSAITGENITLLTEQQWQRAAQGDDGRMYPWGNEPPRERQCNWHNKVGHTTPVTQYPVGAGPHGVMDMYGNVWEWCLTAHWSGSHIFQTATDTYVLRGGSWRHDHWYARGVVSQKLGAPYVREDDIGFRVCASAPT